MDPRVAGAGVAMALGMMLLLPTFNALNNSYLTDVAPPPWMPTPDEIPEDFVPPEDWEPPEDWTPPEDWEPPPGFEPPPGYDGPIPPGGCPPPVIRSLDENRTIDMTTPWSGPDEWPFTIPEYTVAILANVTFENWRAQAVHAELLDPEGNEIDRGDQTGPVGGLLTPAQPVSETEFTLQFIPESLESEEDLPPQGEYTLRITAELPISGTYATAVSVVLPCGGMLS